MPTRTLSLHTILLLDAATCIAMGALLALAAGPLATWTGLPPLLLLVAGLGLLPIAALMAVAAHTLRPALVRLVIAGNLAWFVGSLLLLVSGWVEPTGLGIAFVLAQALAVALLAWLEHAALGGARPAPAAT